ncbi:MAG: lysophospholipid transporter LplT [Rhodoferax sp.]|nr:lysophospholipid transporter LplT [Rhodoferax sp.]MCF8208773.1 lysophospholipid transporter LplT [Rhodoferax sp.]
MPKTFFLVLAVQLISTVADNAFLIVTIARTVELKGSEWLIPVLKIGFTLFYVILAPLVGPVADLMRKGHVMVIANLLKVSAILVLISGAHPLIAIAVAGLGATLYAPAKYGLITELLPPRDLVVANGLFEGVTVTAVIFGTVLGGLLISSAMMNAVLLESMADCGLSHSQFIAGMLILLILNAAALTLSFQVSDSGARYVSHSFHPIQLIQRFRRENMALWSDREGGLSMSVTSLLWGVGATLQLIVLRWANESLGLPLAQAAYLQGVTALGVVAGAFAASHTIPLMHATRTLPLGIVIGCLIPLLLLVETVFVASILLVLVGALAGFFVVPMNALLQHRGHTLLTAGRSIAVQGFNENAAMLLMLGIYAVAIALNVPLSTLLIGFGAVVTCTMLAIYLIWTKSSRVPCRNTMTENKMQ